ncbi:Abi-like protein [Actinopolyspora lacussalsi subsp. righensis]|uniref:Abi-like protein n=1 Tax=Actinopolyspora righensis TaxID=995060 RepID=A0A1I7BPK0_9ACTN|nr:Abi family protein [Actinopolyspora righensis]SFT89114.1 Abi-like protein [Actinopolyspora righensis]
MRSVDNQDSGETGNDTLFSLFGVPRMRGYLDACGGDPDIALELYRWNTRISGAFWETLSHLEIVLRNVLARRLAVRHATAGRAGSWLDDPNRELDHRARREITEARQRVNRKGKTASDGQILSELSFGFWRFLLARRYATTLWPDLARGFPVAPTRARTVVEQPVTRLHEFRNRLAHHERIWNQPLKERHDDIMTLLGFVRSDLPDWVAEECRVSAVLVACPIERPYP